MKTAGTIVLTILAFGVGVMLMPLTPFFVAYIVWYDRMSDED